MTLGIIAYDFLQLKCIATSESQLCNFFHLMNNRLLSLYEERIKGENYDHDFLANIYYNNLNRGRSILQTKNEVDAYLACYFGLHFCKLYYSFDGIDFQKLNIASVNLIDWGCGAAVGTIAFIDKFLGKINIEKMILIEPSKVAIDCGVEYIDQILNNEEACLLEKILINCPFEELTSEDIMLAGTSINLHIFSNVLDITSIDLNQICEFISETQYGWNYFLCVSSVSNSAGYSEDRVKNFYKYFSDRFETKCIINFDRRRISTPPIYQIRSGKAKEQTFNMFNGFFAINFDVKHRSYNSEQTKTNDRSLPPNVIRGISNYSNVEQLAKIQK